MKIGVLKEAEPETRFTYMKPGYAGIESELFFQPKTSMLFGDAKKVLQDLLTEIKNT